MLEEQRKTVSIFRQHYEPDFKEPFVIYGTGINAEAVVKSCRDYPIAGLMDASHTGETLWGKRVLSEEEVIRAGIRKVVVIARPSVHTIIYKRIQAWSEEHAVRIMDIWGNNIADRVQTKICDSPYFEKSYEQLLQEIDRHDVICFDIFDTLLIRKVYEPQDVFTLLELEYDDRFSFVFSSERKRAEQELLEQGEPDIFQIYRQIKKNNPCLTAEECDSLLEREIQKERQVLTPRKKMLDCLDYCVEKGKDVYLVSDMYFPEAILSDILTYFGITQYKKLFVSCNYKMSKQNGLFREVREYVGEGRACLHIGDHPYADGEMPKKEGIDSFLIMSPRQMMEISACSELLVYVKGIESRIMLGLIMAELFHDPFILHHSKGKPLLEESIEFGYLFLGPLVLSFLIWMLVNIKNSAGFILLFSARDGWLFRKIYHQLADKFELHNLPRDEYLLISRKAILSLDDPKEAARRKQYLKYISKMQLESVETIYFFDFMSRGTCQYQLERMINRQCVGLYFQKSNCGDSGRDSLKVESYYKERNAQESQRHIFALCDFLECIFTSFDASFLGFDENEQPVYEKERRTAEQLACVKEIHCGIQNYCAHFSEMIPRFPKHMPPVDFSDYLLGMMNSPYIRLQIPELKEMILDDELCGEKDAGRNIFV